MIQKPVLLLPVGGCANRRQERALIPDPNPRSEVT
jgi:hypothetical protein